VIAKVPLVDWIREKREEFEPYLVEKMITPARDNSLKGEIEKARQEWTAACQYFDQVSEPDLVDYATYAMAAARKKYMYLLKRAKNNS